MVEDETKVIKGELVIKLVEVKIDPREPEEVQKIIFVTDKGTIGYKANKEVEEFQQGLRILKTKRCRSNELPPFVVELGRLAMEGKQPHVYGEYCEWKKDGSVYLFIRGAKMYDKWKILPEKPIEEEKVV